MGLDHSDHIFGTILDVYAAAGSTRTNDFIDNSRPCDHNRKLCGSSHITPKFVTYIYEDIHDKAQELIECGLGLVNVQVERSVRLQSRNDKPGLVKIKLPTVNDKVTALRAKRNLLDTGYRRVYIRSSLSHSDRIMQQNLQTILSEIHNGESYRVTGHGKIVKKDNAKLSVQFLRYAIELLHVKRRTRHK